MGLLTHPPKWNDFVGFLLICLGATFVFAPWQTAASHPVVPVRSGSADGLLDSTSS
jgi:hypothetical protein